MSIFNDMAIEELEAKLDKQGLKLEELAQRADKCLAKVKELKERVKKLEKSEHMMSGLSEL